MAGYFYLFLAASCMAVSAAPPTQHRVYQQHAPGHLQQANPAVEYYLEHTGADNYYMPAEQNQVAVNNQNGESARLESLEPDSEVELVPGVQQPQQPPQQNPVAPNIPGLLPGQRVFIVHMPVPGYRPGTIGGYQPVYIVAAGAQGNPAYPGNGFQNAVLLDPSGQAVVSPLIGYGPQGAVPPQLLGAPVAQRPYEYQVYQNPGVVNGAAPSAQSEADRDSIRFSNLVGLQGPVYQTAYPGPVVLQGAYPNKKGVNVASAPAQLKQVNQETKESEPKAEHRDSSALLRNKA